MGGDYIFTHKWKFFQVNCECPQMPCYYWVKGLRASIWPTNSRNIGQWSATLTGTDHRPWATSLPTQRFRIPEFRMQDIMKSISKTQKQKSHNNHLAELEQTVLLFFTPVLKEPNLPPYMRVQLRIHELFVVPEEKKKSTTCHCIIGWNLDYDMEIKLRKGCADQT